MITLNQAIYTLGLLVGFYILNHIIRLTTKLNYCAKCGSLLMTLITISFLRFPIQISALLVGSLFTILTYYTDDFLMNKKKINLIGQDFMILLSLLSIYLLVMLW